MFKYKNVTDQVHALNGVGLIKPGQVFETEQEVINSNFAPVQDEEPKPSKKTK